MDNRSIIQPLVSSSINIDFQQVWTTSGPPQSTLVVNFGGAVFQYDCIIDIVNNNIYLITTLGSFDGVSTYTGCVLTLQTTQSNINGILSSSGYVPYTAWTQSSVSLAFGTSRTPSATQNTTVAVSINQSSILATAAIAKAQVNISGTFTDFAFTSLSGLITTQTNSMTFDVPKNTSYKLVNVSGTNSIISIFETYK